MGANNIELIWKSSTTAIHFLQLRRHRVVCLKLNDLRFRQRRWAGQRLRSSTVASITPFSPKSIGPPQTPPSFNSELMWVGVLKKWSAVVAITVALVLTQLSNPLCASALPVAFRSRTLRKRHGLYVPRELKSDGEPGGSNFYWYLTLFLLLAEIMKIILYFVDIEEGKFVHFQKKKKEGKFVEIEEEPQPQPSAARIALEKPENCEKARGVEDVTIRAAQMGQITEKVSDEERPITLLEQINTQDSSTDQSHYPEA